MCMNIYERNANLCLLLLKCFITINLAITTSFGMHLFNFQPILILLKFYIKCYLIKNKNLSLQLFIFVEFVIDF